MQPGQKGFDAYRQFPNIPQAQKSELNRKHNKLMLAEAKKNKAPNCTLM